MLIKIKSVGDWRKKRIVKFTFCDKFFYLHSSLMLHMTHERREIFLETFFRREILERRAYCKMITHGRMCVGKLLLLSSSSIKKWASLEHLKTLFDSPSLADVLDLNSRTNLYHKNILWEHKKATMWYYTKHTALKQKKYNKNEMCLV